MNERLHLRTSGEQLSNFYETQDPLDATRTLGLEAISTVALVDKISALLDQNAIVMADSEESKQSARTALEKLRIAQGRKPGDSVSVPIPEPGSKVRAVRKPVKMTSRTPGKK